jgi:hypothetical protein
MPHAISFKDPGCWCEAELPLLQAVAWWRRRKNTECFLKMATFSQRLMVNTAQYHVYPSNIQSIAAHARNYIIFVTHLC